MKEVLEKIRKHFDFLFQDGFEIAESVGSGLGSWIVYLRSNRFIAMIVHDRGEILVHLAPPNTRGRKLPDLHFIDSQSVIAYLSKNIKYAYYQRLPDEIDPQFRKIAKELRTHYEAICSFFEKSNFPREKKDFELFREEERKHSLEPYLYKPRKK